MRWIYKVAVLLFLSVGTNAAHAQSTRNAELDEVDQQLNATYSALMKQLSPGDQVALRAAQRVWIQFRDTDCAFGWADRRDCLIQRTEEREKQLRESTYFDARGALFRIATKV